MLVDQAELATDFAEAAQAAMRRHAVTPTPRNFAVWYEYSTGRNVELKRTLDIYVSNRQPIDDDLLTDLYHRFFNLLEDHQSVWDTSRKVQAKLRGFIALVSAARGQADTEIPASNQGSLAADLRELTVLIDSLVSETLALAGRSKQLNQHLESSTTEVESLQRMLDETRREATTDGLTNASNRKAFDLKLRQLAGDAMNSGDDLCLLMIDIDHFKRVNDTLGHQAGDEVLRLVATTLRQTIRKQDFLARYGGEEFAIILDGASPVTGEIVAEKIRHAIAVMPPPPDRLLWPDSITISVGLSCFDPGEMLTDWIERVDGALYRAKREGRNRVSCAAIPT